MCGESMGGDFMTRKEGKDKMQTAGGVMVV